jgi:hypothetical protein
MNLNDWAAVASLVASVVALFAVLRGSFIVGKIYQQFETVLEDVADLKKHRTQFDEQLTKLLARCKMCLDEGAD